MHLDSIYTRETEDVEVVPLPFCVVNQNLRTSTSVLVINICGFCCSKGRDLDLFVKMLAEQTWASALRVQCKIPQTPLATITKSKAQSVEKQMNRKFYTLILSRNSKYFIAVDCVYSTVC